jgi:tetratricopeptide (TPR) repeat protein
LPWAAPSLGGRAARSPIRTSGDPEAEAAYRQALRLRPDFPETHSNLGATLRMLGKPAAAARFAAEAFAARPKLADDLRFPNRRNAACSAALAGCGQGQDAAKLDDAERARLRRQALDWLRADLAAWGALLDQRRRDSGQKTAGEEVLPSPASPLRSVCAPELMALKQWGGGNTKDAGPGARRAHVGEMPARSPLVRAVA